MRLLLERERTSTWTVMYALYLYFLGLSFRSTARAIEPFAERSHVAIWYWVQKFGSIQIYRRRRVSAYLIDETQVQIGHDEAWVWVAIEPVHRTVLGVYVSRHRNILVAESFLRSLVKLYGKHTVYSDGGPWYPDACHSLGLEHRLHSEYEKSLIERTIEYFKDRTECFDDYYPCIKHGGGCDISHVYSWMRLFVFMCNNRKYTFGKLYYYVINDGG